MCKCLLVYLSLSDSFTMPNPNLTIHWDFVATWVMINASWSCGAGAAVMAVARDLKVELSGASRIVDLELWGTDWLNKLTRTLRASYAIEYNCLTLTGMDICYYPPIMPCGPGLALVIWGTKTILLMHMMFDLTSPEYILDLKVLNTIYTVYIYNPSLNPA